MNPQICLTQSDARRLKILLSSPPRSLDAEGLKWLGEEVDRARIVPDGEIPPDVISLNSTVEIEDLSDGEVSTFTLVLPAEANPAAGRISLLAPLGMGMIGYREGDEFEWPLPAGTARYRVRRVVDNAENRIALSAVA